MNEQQIRTAIIDALDAAYISTFRAESARENFLNGSNDYLFEELDIDSLGMMEFCISLEINDVISITPEKVQRLNSLNQLVQQIKSSGQ